MDNRDYIQDEISLRELIEVILKGKKLIAIITLAAVLLSGIYSFVMLRSTYESTISLLTSPVINTPTTLEGVDSITEYFNNIPNMTVETYMEQILSPAVLSETIKTLDLRDEEGNYISRASLKSIIRVANAKSTNLIHITVSGQDPEKATLIANTLGNTFIHFITDNTRKQSRQAAKLIEEQLAIEEENINIQSKKLAEYLKKSQNIDALKGEVESLITQTVEFKAEANTVDLQINSDKEALKKLGKPYAQNNDDVKVNVNINELSELEKEIQLSIADNSKLQNSLLAIDINKIQTRLIENISRKQSLDVKIEEMQSNLNKLQTTVAEEEYKYNAINRDLELAKQAYNAYQQRHKESMIAAATDLGQTNIVVSSEAIIPIQPVSPNRVLNVAVAGVLGVMLGVFIVFFREYWKTSALDVKEQSK